MDSLLKIPIEITKNMEDLNNLVKEYPQSIPVEIVAKFLGAKVDGLRASIEHNQCPFGIAWQLGSHRAFKIPTATFYFWYTGISNR